MASPPPPPPPPPPLDRTLFQRRLSFAEHPYIPLTPPPLSPLSDSTSGTPTPTATLPLNSHYYRPPRSTLTSPTRSIISSTAGSPTRTARQTRVQSILANDPLLSRLTTATISRLSNDPDFAFSPAEKEWSLRAAEGVVKVGEWLREVEAWNREWRRNGKCPGVGYLPPNLDRPKKRWKVGLEGKGEMGSIKEETGEEEEEEELGGRSRPLRRRLVWDRSTDTSDNEEEGRGGNGVSKRSAVEGTNGRQPRKPLTPHQLKLRKQKAEAHGENVPVKEALVATPAKSDRPIHEEYDGESTDEDEEGVEYWGSLRKTTVEHCLARVEIIKSEIEELDVEALKSRVLAYRTNPLTGITNPLTDSSAIITAITLQLLPPLHRLTKLLSIWAVRLAVLRIVPVFLRWLQIAGDALDAGYAAINHPSISPNRFSLQDNTSWRGLEEETFTLMQETITQKVATAGKLMDTMLDALEGREDVLPDVWIAELEDVEERVGAWEMDGERVVLEGRLCLEELRQRESRREEQEREREKARLIMEQEQFAEEARGAESVVGSVMEHAEETERGLREALEANEDVVEGIELVGDEDTEGSGDEGAVPGEISELLMRLEGIEKERLFSREASDSETEEVEHEDGLFDPNSWRVMGSYADALPGQHRVLRPHHGLSLGSFTQPDLDPGSTTFHAPMQTPFAPQGELANNDRRASSIVTEYYTPMQTPGMQQESPPSRPGSTTPTQSQTPMPTQFYAHMPTPLILPSLPKLRRHSTTPYYTPMPTPLMPAFQQGPPVLRRQPSMPCMPVPKLPPTAQILTTTARREPSSPETPKRVPTEVEKDVKKTSPILAVARYLFGIKKEETKKERAKREEREKEEARRKDEEEREMIAVVDAETERLAKLEEAEKERAAKVKAVMEKLAEAEKMREKERAAREIEEKRKVAEAERKRLAEEEERRKKAELEAARAKAEEEEKLRLEVEWQKAELERIAALEAAALDAARLKAEEEERQRVAEEKHIAEAKEEAERQRQTSLERLAAFEAACVKAEEVEAQRKRLAEEEAERLAALEASRLAAEAERQRLAEEAERERQAEVDRLAAIEATRVKAEEEAERQRQAEIERLAAIEAAKLKAEAERLRLIEEEEERKRQAEAERIAAIEAAQAEVAAERRRVAMEESETKRQMEVQRIATVALAHLAEEQRRQAEVERLAALEAARLEAEAERLRLIEEEEEEEAERQRQAETERLAAIEAARVKAEEEERVRLAEEEAEQQRQVEAERLAALEAARLKAEAEAEAEAERLRLIEEEKVEQQRQAEIERLAAIEAARVKAEEEERIRLAEEEAERQRQVEAERLAALEAARLKAEAEAEAERLRLIEEEKVEQQRQAEIERLAAIEAARVKAEEEERIRLAEEEVERQRQVEAERLAALEAARLKAEAEAEVEHLRLIEEAERQRQAEIERLAVIEVARVKAEEEERIRLAEEEAERQRQVEAERVAALEVARLEAEAERIRVIEEEAAAERRQLAEKEAELERLAAIEAERQRSLEVARAAEVGRQRLVEEEVEKKRHADAQHLAALEATRTKAEAEAEARRNAEAIRSAEEEVARQLRAESEAIEAARVEQEEVERQRMAELEAERLRAIEQEAENERRITLEIERLRVIEQETERQRHAALEAARLEAEEEAERLRILEQERKAEAERLVAIEEAERQQEEQRIAEAEARKAENERLAALEAEAAERLRAIEDEEIRKLTAEQEAAEAEAERRQEGFDSEDEAELQMIARIKKAALEADAELYRQQVIEDEEQHRWIAAYEAEREAEQAKEKQIAGEIERQRVQKFQEEQRWEAEEQAERARISADIAAFEAANAEDERQRAIQEEEIQRRIAAEEEIEHRRFAETEEKAESDLMFEELDRRRRLAEDERQRLADLALVEREQQRLAAQEAERLKMEKRIEETRLEAERLREQEEEKRRQAQFSNNQGSNSDSISGDDITEDYQDVPSPVQSLPLNEADEDSESENIYAEARKNQPVSLPSVSMTPITSRSSSILDKIKYTTPKATKGVSSVPSSTPWSPESPDLGITPGASKSQDDSEASSDMDDLVAAENLAAHNSLQQALNDSIDYELPRNMQSDMSGGSFNEMPSIFVASSTPQHHSDIDDSKNVPKTIWDHAAHPPVFDEDDSPLDSSADGPFPSDLNVDGSSYPQLLVEDYEQEDYSDSDMVPLATSTPKPKRRPNMQGGLDSITEVLTPRSPQDGFFRPSDDNAFSTPSKKLGKSGNLTLPGGLSIQDSPTSRRRSFNDRKVTPISLDLGSLQNKHAVKRGTTPEPKAPIKAQRSQKSIRKAPLDMARPRSLSSTGNYISPGSTTTKPAPKPASQRATLGPTIKAIRRPHMEIDSDDEGSVISEQRWSRSKENTPDFHSSPPTPNLGPVPRLKVNKRNTQKPSNLNTQAMPDRSKRYQQKISHDKEGSVSSQGTPQTPRLEFPQASLEDKVNEILASLPSPVRLTASNLQRLSETSNKRQPPLRPFELTSPTGIPAPKSVGSSSMVSDAPSLYAPGGRKHNPSTPGDIKLYHLHRNDGQAPIKLYIRLVGERGERVMVRVGGGWADLAEYLKEYASHHASKRRTVSGGGIEIQDLSGPHHHTLHPSRSISSLRSNSPAPGNSRSNSPSPGDRSRSVSAVRDRSRSNSALGNRPASSMGNHPASSMGNRPASSMGVRGRERSSSLVRSPPLITPPAVMRGGHNGTGKERSNLTPFQPLAYQRPSGLSPPGPPPSGSRPPSRGQGANRPPSRPGSSHSAVGGIRRSASRLSFTESAFDPSEAGSSAGSLPKPLGLAGPKGKKTTISPESQAWVEGMMGEVLKASKGRRLTGGSNNGDMGLGDESSVVPGEMEVQSGTRRLFLKMG